MHDFLIFYVQIKIIYQRNFYHANRYKFLNIFRFKIDYHCYGMQDA